jgi:anti-anti-sigma regulatory factor
MSRTTTIHAHIAYDLIDDTDPEVIAVEFLSQEIAGPYQARELGEQLDSLIRPDLPQSFVIDFGNVRTLGSTAFGAIVCFARKAESLCVCNLQEHLRLGATLIGLDECAEFAPSRRAAINAARRAAMRDQEATVDYPATWVEFDEAGDRAPESA